MKLFSIFCNLEINRNTDCITQALLQETIHPFKSSIEYDGYKCLVNLNNKALHYQIN